MKTHQSFLFFILAILTSFECFGHKDIIHRETNGRVVTIIKTGFEYADIYKMQIIGKLANGITQKLNYKDSIVIEYEQDYTKFFERDIFRFENNITEMKFINENGDNQLGLNDGKGFSIRICAENLNIEDVLKIVEYAIHNNKTLVKSSKTTSVSSRFHRETESEGIYLQLIPEEFLRKITSKKSKIVDELIKNKIELLKPVKFGVNVSWQANMFLFDRLEDGKITKRLFEIENFYYLKDVSVNYMLVFVDGKNFYFLSASDEMPPERFEIDIESYRPAQVLPWYENKLVISTGYNSFNVFLMDKRKLISEFE